MNFSDIPTAEILNFLNVNKHYPLIDNTIYNQAIQLINDHDVIMTSYMKNWLLAYDYQDCIIKLKKPLSYYHQLFKDSSLNHDDVFMILSHYHLVIQLLPDDILQLIIIMSDDALRFVNKSLNQRYTTITNQLYFQIQKCNHVLLAHGYDDMNYDQFNLKYIYHVLNGKCIDSHEMPEDIRRIKRLMNQSFCISKSGKLYIKKDTEWSMTNVSIPVNDIQYDHELGYVILSRGKVYTGVVSEVNKYNYDVRLSVLKPNHLKQIENMNNVIAINPPFMLKTNGDIYTYNNGNLSLIQQIGKLNWYNFNN
ncbi:MAG TPA: hypothetical protein VLG50_08235 [Candidatus Saccharimonadales bacterium]|nr:hypothetical protein [Candidatus Saccharimonadales bacterium]